MVTLGQNVFNTLILLVYNFLSANIPHSNDVHPDQGLSIKELVPKYGYPFEEHVVQTDDGYLLTMFRIPHGIKNTTESANRKPVLILHGILSSAQDLVTFGPEIGLAYLFADLGYDVWLGNCRGNTWSRKHVKYHPDEPRFWKFSFHEMGYYDLPAKIDYITEKTGFPSLYIIGHSQGATSTLVMASERQEYIKKVKLFVALAPVAFPGKAPSLVAQLCATFYRQIEWLAFTFDYQEVLPHSEILTEAYRLFCQAGSQYARVCYAVMYTNFGYSSDIDPGLVPLIYSYFPAGSSIRQFLHFVQNKIADDFRKYDHGTLTNLMVYGQSAPPKYNLRTTMPTAIIHSDNDWLSTDDDVERICDEIKNLKFKYKLPGQYSHVDYLYGRQATKIVSKVVHKLFTEN